MREKFPCDFKKACEILYAVKVMGWSQTKAAIDLRVNVGTVSKVIRGKRHPDAKPIPPVFVANT